MELTARAWQWSITLAKIFAACCYIFFIWNLFNQDRASIRVRCMESNAYVYLPYKEAFPACKNWLSLNLQYIRTVLYMLIDGYGIKLHTYRESHIKSYAKSVGLGLSHSLILNWPFNHIIVYHFVMSQAYFSANLLLGKIFYQVFLALFIISLFLAKSNFTYNLRKKEHISNTILKVLMAKIGQALILET